jgi:single-strand DNA-binding protein
MSAANTTVVVGNLTADPETRRTSAEVEFIRMRIAVNRRWYNPERRDWEDRQDGYYTVNVWREPARNCAMSLRKGDRVVVLGRLLHREYELPAADEESQPEKRHIVEIEAEEVGASLRFNAWRKVTARPLAEVDAPPAAPTGEPDEDDAPVADRTGVTAAA